MRRPRHREMRAFFSCLAWRAMPSPLSKLKRRLDSLWAQVANAEDAEMQVQSLGQEGPLEKEMATHSSVLVWRLPGTVEPGGLPSMGSHTPGESGLVSRGSQGLRSPLESRRGSLGAP